MMISWYIWRRWEMRFGFGRFYIYIILICFSDDHCHQLLHIRIDAINHEITEIRNTKSLLPLVQT